MPIICQLRMRSAVRRMFAGATPSSVRLGTLVTGKMSRSKMSTK
jgi:hypothetical protein